MPWSDWVDPYAVYPPAAHPSPDTAISFAAERYMHTWLEKNGYDYDVVSDRDLHDDRACSSIIRS